MDFKKVLKVLLFAVVVPGGSALIAYHGAKLGLEKYDKWKTKREAGKANPELKEESNEGNDNN